MNITTGMMIFTLLWVVSCLILYRQLVRKLEAANEDRQKAYDLLLKANEQLDEVEKLHKFWHNKVDQINRSLNCEN